MKQLWLSLFFVATLLVACSNPETTQEATTQNTESTAAPTASAMTTTEGNAENAALAESTTMSAEEMNASPTEAIASSAANQPAVSRSTTAAPPKPQEAIEPVEEGIKEVAQTATKMENDAKSVVTTAKNTTTTSRPVSVTSVAPAKPAKPAKQALSHDAFDQLLRKHVSSSGGVNYSGFKKDKAKLAAYLDLLKANTPQSSWSKNKEMAYWINMYNAFTIYSIVEKYPVNSVMDLEGGKVWDKKKITVNGKSLTLNIIEKEKLLKRFKEPRVHFAVNCAAASCPPLLNKAWTEDNVQRYFDKQAKAFINNSKHNTISAKTIEASQIFNWYAGDFGGSDKIVSYFQKYSNTEIKNNAKVKFKEYDWKLNKQ